MTQRIEARKNPKLLLVDDDDLTRELLALIAAEAGFAAEGFPSGDAALAHLPSASDTDTAYAILCDLQMPGTCGPALAEGLRALCGPEVVLLAMSGSAPLAAALSGYDGFLLKPFSAEALRDALAGAPDDGPDRPQTREAQDELPALDRDVYAKFAAAMPPVQMAGLYAMCLDDAEQRLEKMRTALAAGDDAAWRKLAHAIKGGCGMVGALELARLAAAMEEHGLPPLNDDAPLRRFMAAAAQLRRSLETR